MTREEAREHLKDILYDVPSDKCIDWIEALNLAIKTLEQEPKTGYWIEVIDEIDSLGNKTWHYKCSICGNENSGWGAFKYCPDCGAKMESET